MQEFDLREKYISLLTEKGLSRETAEETVDIIDEDGNVVGLISEDALHLETGIRDILRMQDVREELAAHILETFPSIPDQLRHILEEETKKPNPFPPNEET